MYSEVLQLVSGGFSYTDMELSIYRNESRSLSTRDRYNTRVLATGRTKSASFGYELGVVRRCLHKWKRDLDLCGISYWVPKNGFVAISWR